MDEMRDGGWLLARWLLSHRVIANCEFLLRGGWQDLLLLFGRI
jgi:hypothetical protein